MSHPATSFSTPSPAQRVVVGCLASFVGGVSWKVFDTPIHRQLSRHAAPEVIAHLELVVGAVIPLAMVVPAILLLWKTYTGATRRRNERSAHAGREMAALESPP